MRERIVLEVRVVFEPSRIASDCLASAYEQVLPLPAATEMCAKQEGNKQLVGVAKQ